MGTKTLISADEFQKLSFDDDYTYELDEGEVVRMAPAADEHARIAGNITFEICGFLKQHRIGQVFTADPGFRLGEAIVRAPDLAFVRYERLPPASKSFFHGPPDLAVEVFSPSDSVPQLMRKVRQYLHAGCHTVWVVYPDRRQVHVMGKDGTDRILEVEDTLDAPELLPGFSVRVGDLFDQPAGT
jgi:Uma2 family endonuclease